jgi:hypothetical protein
MLHLFPVLQHKGCNINRYGDGSKHIPINMHENTTNMWSVHVETETTWSRMCLHMLPHCFCMFLRVSACGAIFYIMFPHFCDVVFEFVMRFFTDTSTFVILCQSALFCYLAVPFVLLPQGPSTLCVSSLRRDLRVRLWDFHTFVLVPQFHTVPRFWGAG